ncbi:MAG: hypothetical protein WC931_02175 [Bacilli bacterium]|jgi:hypothetical protein
MPIEQHTSTNEDTLLEHVQRAHIALGEELSGKTAIYLDMNYWIRLREAAAGNPHEDIDTALLTFLLENVAIGRLFCPISEATCLELGKQDDPESRAATAKLIGDLSLGVTLIDSQRRVALEIIHSLPPRIGESLPPLKYLVWTRLTSVMGLAAFTEAKLGTGTMAISFFKHVWNMPLSESLPLIFGRSNRLDVFQKTANDLNAENLTHSGDLRSFLKAYSDELSGLIDLCVDTSIDFIIETAGWKGGPISGQGGEQTVLLKNSLKNYLFQLMKKKTTNSSCGKAELQDILPTLHIMASLGGSVRRDKRRPLKANDLFDFWHAAAAIAYCDSFFTEKALRTMVMQKNLALDERHHCHVIADPVEALEYLRNLGRIGRNSP